MLELGWLGVHRPMCPYMVSCELGNGCCAVHLQLTPMALSSHIMSQDCSTTISGPYTSCTICPIHPIQPWHAHQGSEDGTIIPDNQQKGSDKVRYLAQSCEFLLQGLISVAWCRLGAQETSNSEKWRVSLQADHCHRPRSSASGRSACKLTLHFCEFSASCSDFDFPLPKLWVRCSKNVPKT